MPVEDRVDMRSFVGRTIAGKYVLRECLGEGGFGGVFRSDQEILGKPTRRVAVKLSRRGGLSPETARELFADAFLLTEAMDSITNASARQHLVHVYDAGITDGDGRGFLVMEFVEGTTLAEQFVSMTRVPASLLMKWAAQVCTALAGLHALAQPMVHRDLKPDNVLLGVDKTVRLVDFGLAAKLLSVGYADGVAGTFAYMAPETSQGRSVPSSDVYSLGLLIYEGLTGQHAFKGLTPPLSISEKGYSGWLYRTKRTWPVSPPSALNNTVSAELDALVLRCLDFEPGRRFRDASALLVEIGTLDNPVRTEWELALDEARTMRSEGDLPRARGVLEHALSAVSVPPHGQFGLLREWGDVARLLGNHAEAAARYGEAWEVTKDRAILRDTRERVALVTQVAESYREAGNRFQADRYERLRRRLLGDGP